MIHQALGHMVFNRLSYTIQRMSNNQEHPENNMDHQVPFYDHYRQTGRKPICTPEVIVLIGFLLILFVLLIGYFFIF